MSIIFNLFILVLSFYFRINYSTIVQLCIGIKLFNLDVFIVFVTVYYLFFLYLIGIVLFNQLLFEDFFNMTKAIRTIVFVTCRTCVKFKAWFHVMACSTNITSPSHVSRSNCSKLHNMTFRSASGFFLRNLIFWWWTSKMSHNYFTIIIKFNFF